MRYPHDAPAWLEKILADQEAQILDSLVNAKSQERLWNLQGCLVELNTIKAEIHLMGEQEEAAARELEERMTERG